MQFVIHAGVVAGLFCTLFVGVDVRAGTVDGISGASYLLPALPRSPREVRDAMQEWLQTHWFMSLATVDSDGQPHVAGVTFYVEDMVVYFKTDANSTKALNIEHNPRVSYTVWDKVSDMQELRALQVVGRAEVLDGEERDRIAAILDGAPGTTRANLEQYFHTAGIQNSYAGKRFDANRHVVIGIRPTLARFNDNTISMGRSDVYRFDLPR